MLTLLLSRTQSCAVGFCVSGVQVQHEELQVLGWG